MHTTKELSSQLHLGFEYIFIFHDYGLIFQNGINVVRSETKSKHQAQQSRHSKITPALRRPRQKLASVQGQPVLDSEPLEKTRKGEQMKERRKGGNRNVCKPPPPPHINKCHVRKAENVHLHSPISMVASKVIWSSNSIRGLRDCASLQCSFMCHSLPNPKQVVVGKNSEELTSPQLGGPQSGA